MVKKRNAKDLKKTNNVAKEIAENVVSIVKNAIPNIDTIGFDGGLCGIGLFMFYRYQKYKRKDDLEVLYTIFEVVIEKINSRRVTYKLISIDFTEVLIFIRLTKGMLIKKYSTNNLEKMLYERLEEFCKIQIKNRIYDPYVGGFFPIYYFVLANKVEWSLNGLRLLDDNIVFTDANVAFFDSKFREGKIALGITHGVAFYINLICLAISRNIYTKNSGLTLRLLVNYLIGESQDSGQYGSFFPDYAKEFKKTRLSLCYGDLGVLYSLYSASLVLGDAPLKQRIHKMLYAVAKRRVTEDTGINDTGLLYGSSGIYLFFMRLFYLSNDPQFKSTANFWYSIAINEVSKEYEQKPKSMLSFQNGLLGSLTVLDSLNKKKVKNIASLFYL